MQKTKGAFYSRLKRHFQTRSISGLTHLLIPNPASEELSVVDDPKQMVEALISQNKKHFLQADGTAFTTAPFKDIIGNSGTTNNAIAILNGIPPAATLPKGGAWDLLFQLTQGKLPPIHSNITPEEMRKAFHKWRESTSTSPSGRHLGHYRAVLEIPNQSNGTDTPTMAQPILHLHTNMSNWAVENNHVYPRWQKVVSTMLEKIPGQPRVDKLRTIHLVETDLNMILGIIWGRRILSQAEIHRSLNQEQWGSRKRQAAIDVALLKRLSYTVSRLTQSPLGTMDNDAKACYDRIIMPLALMRGHQLGLTHPPICTWIAKTYRQFNFHIKTAHGISNQSYTTDSTFTQHGSGQCLKCSPSIWLLIPTLCMDAMKHKTVPFQIQNPNGTLDSTRCVDGYVDDVTLWTNQRGHKNKTRPIQLVHK